MTRIDAAAMNLFLAELSQAVAPGAHGIVLMDKAGWHTAGELCVPENLSLVFLPPYSPELNPIERLWLHLRDNRLSHCVFQNNETMKNAIRNETVPRGFHRGHDGHRRRVVRDPSRRG
jgi:transposase